ncbi:MAG: DUF366 family protein [Desulforudis sp.]|jgi:hypothetical protein|nr:MAG: DUF366 family protein [Desulforudis sp.]
MGNVQHLVDREEITYDGTQLTSLWAFRRYRLQGNSIVSFRGPCRVDVEKLVDAQDTLDGAFIYSPDMLHFIVEHFDNDLEKAVYRQRLLVVLIRDVLKGMLGVGRISRTGDDLYVEDRKLSVSIATVSPVSTLIHTGLNIDATGTPVPAVGLVDLNLGGEAVYDLASRICRAYTAEIASIFLARCKVRGVS